MNASHVLKNPNGTFSVVGRAAIAAGALLLALVLPAGAEEPTKKPRVRPQQSISVKVQPVEHYAAKAGEAPYYLSTVSATTCTAWVPAPGGEAPELAAYRACRAELAKGRQ